MVGWSLHVVVWKVVRTLFEIIYNMILCVRSLKAGEGEVRCWKALIYAWIGIVRSHMLLYDSLISPVPWFFFFFVLEDFVLLYCLKKDLYVIFVLKN